MRKFQLADHELQYEGLLGQISRPFAPGFVETARPATTIFKEIGQRSLSVTNIAQSFAITGADISSWQGDIDGDAFCSKVDFMFIRAGVGNDYIDPKLERNLIMAGDHNKPYGLYWYLKPEKSWQKHAQAFAAIANQYKYNLRLIFDLEETGGLSKTSLESWYSKCIRETEQLTGLPITGNCADGAYTSPGFLNKAIALTNWLKYRKLMVAHWTTLPSPTRPNEWLVPNFPYEFWQHAVSPDGYEFGCESKMLDHQRFYGSAQQFADTFNLEESEFPIPPVFPEPEPPIESGFRMKVIQPGLRKRTEPTYTSKIVGTFEGGEIVTPINIHGTDAFMEYYDAELDRVLFVNIKQNSDRNMEPVD